ncbi:MAG: cation:proton antiporter, partial [Deltaproteobacteria bacterium]|nr:cation:proton antiporter [Deltaproteobacteria bacterium]
MIDPHEFLTNLAMVLCVAAVTTVLFQWLRQPVVLGYLLAGVLIGPHVPIPLVVNGDMVPARSELGVILLMFSLGLEFSLSKLMRVVRRAGLVALIETSIMVWLGYLAGRLLGFGALPSLFVGSMIAISSTTIVAKAFEEQKTPTKLREVVFAILIAEDLIAVLLVAILTAVSTGGGLSPAALAETIGRLAAFLIGVVVVGLLTVPRVVRAIVKLGRPETTLVASIGICFALSLLAIELGYSVALGAFLGGSLVAESGHSHDIEKVVHPVRDMFGAIFFVASGMLIDPAILVDHAGAIALLTGLVVAGKILGVSTGAFLAGYGTRKSIQAGMSLAQIGEFSFIIAGVGVTLGAASPSLYAIAVAVSALTTLLTPWLMKASDPVARFVDRKLPHRLQTFASMYERWLEQLRSRPRAPTIRTRVRGLIRLLVADTVAIAIIVITTARAMPTITAWVGRELSIAPEAAHMAVIAMAGMLVLLFAVGVFRCARSLGLVLGTQVFPSQGGVDVLTAPRRTLVLTLQLVCVLAVGVPLLALTQPFVGAPGAGVMALVLLVYGLFFWRSTTSLQGHVRAGSQVLLEALATQTAH